MTPLFIEINLLPSEHRGPEATPPGLFAALVVSVLLAAGATFGVVTVTGRHGKILAEVRERDGILRGLEKQAAEIEKLEAQVAELEKRHQQILALAESRLPWALKLVQLHEALPEQLWIEKLQLQPARGGRPGRIVLTCVTFAPSADGSDRLAEIRRALASHPAFFHHFREDAAEDQFTAVPPADGSGAWRIRFTINLPLTA